MSLFEGVSTAYHGVSLAYTDEKIGALQHKTLKTLFVTLLLTYIALVWLVAPLQFLLWLLSSVLPHYSSETNPRWYHMITDADTYAGLQERFTVAACMRQMVWFIPFAVLLVIRYITGGFEDHFFCMLEKENKELFDKLAPLQPMHVSEILFRQAKRLGRLSFKGMLLYVLWVFPTLSCLFIPFIYIMQFPDIKRRQRSLALLAFGVVFLATFRHRTLIGHFLLVVVYVFSRLNKYYQASHTKERIAALLFCVLVASPLLQSWALTFINLSITTTALAVELLDPYLVRARLDEEQIRKLISNNRKLILGYGMPLILLVSIPLVGLSAWGYIQASAASLLAQMTEVEINLKRARLKSQ